MTDKELKKGLQLKGASLMPNDDSYKQVYDFAYDSDGEFIVHSGQEWLRKFSWEQIRLFMHFEGLYSIPTIEVCDIIDDLIGENFAIEIGAGKGLWGQELGIHCTDSKLQTLPEIAMYYAMNKQPTIQYPEWVEKLRANQAIKKYKPHTVFASYFTPVINLEDSEEYVYRDNELSFPINGVKRYIKIGTHETHGSNPLMQVEHNQIYNLNLITRSNRGDSRIFVWDF